MDMEPTDRYPDDNPKTLQGAMKPGIATVPPVALLHLGAAMEDGAKKYGAFNWRGTPPA